MPTINQLIRIERKAVVKRKKTPALQACPQLRGVCTRVCPHGNWRLVVDPAVVTPEQESARQQAQEMARHASCAGLCETCLACIQNCPQRAITMPGERNPAARYRHPAVTLSDLITANNLNAANNQGN